MSEKELENVNKNEMKIMVEKKSSEILLRVHAVSERIEQSKNMAKNAQNMKSGLFGRTGRKATATANAVVSTNEAIAEMNNLIQESIKFTCTSVDFSATMHQTMAKMVANGFQKSNGEMVKLNQTGQEFADLIISEAEDFTVKQLEVEKLQQKQSERIDRIKDTSDAKDEELENLIKNLQQESEKHDTELEESISMKTANILSHSDNKDIEHDEQIINIQRISKEFRSVSDSNDERHDRLIREVMDITKGNLNKIKNLENDKKNGYKIISFISLVLSLVATAFSIINFLNG